jgi:hypothetical protein
VRVSKDGRPATAYSSWTSAITSPTSIEPRVNAMIADASRMTLTGRSLTRRGRAGRAAGAGPPTGSPAVSASHPADTFSYQKMPGPTRTPLSKEPPMTTPPAPLVGELGQDKTTAGRRLRAADVDDSHVTAEVSYSRAGEPFTRDRSTRIAIAAWRRRVHVETVEEPAAMWRDPDGALRRLTELDVRTLGDVADGRILADSRFPKHDFVEAPITRPKLPHWIMDRLLRLRLAMPGDPQQCPPTRPGMNLPYQTSAYRLTADGEYLVWSLRAGAQRCRDCGCTEGRRCRFDCDWIAPQRCSGCRTPHPDLRPGGGVDGIQL